MKTTALKLLIEAAKLDKEPDDATKAEAINEALDIVTTLITGIERLAIAVENYNNL